MKFVIDLVKKIVSEVFEGRKKCLVIDNDVFCLLYYIFICIYMYNKMCLKFVNYYFM